MKRKWISNLTTATVALAWGALFNLNAHAATYIWDGGGGNNNWSTAANWNPDAVPALDGDTLRSQSVGMLITEALPITGTTTVFAGGVNVNLAG